MTTPCQKYALDNGFDALDKLLFTTERRAIKGIALLCDNCPAAERAACGARTQSIITPAGAVEPVGTFGGVFYG